MSTAKDIMGATVGLESVALMGRAAQMVPKNPKKMNMMKQNKKMMKGFMDITVGTALMIPTAEMVNKLP